MMGSTPPPLPTQVAALAMLAEVVEILKTSDQAVAKHLADLRSAQADAEKATEGLAAAQAEHDKRRSKLDTLANDLEMRNAFLAEREGKLASASKDLAAREAALTAHGAELATLAGEVSGREEAAGRVEAEQNQRYAEAEAALRLERSKSSNDAAAARRQAMIDAEAVRRSAAEDADSLRAAALDAIKDERAAALRDVAEERRQAKAEHDAREKVVAERERTLAEAQSALRAAMAA